MPKRPPQPALANGFASLGLIEPILRAVEACKYTVPTAIQITAIPALLDGRDVIGSAQTGTGKTAAFALPVLQRVAKMTTPRESKSPRVLVLEPTRELALQVEGAFERYAKHLRSVRVSSAFGGVGKYEQTHLLRVGVDVLVGTPGRVLDLRLQSRLDLSDVQILILDEADRMFELGFVPDVRRLLGVLPPERQTAFFSATLPDPILRFAREVMHNPLRLEANRRSSAAQGIRQRACFVESAHKFPLLVELLHREEKGRSLVFVTAQRDADKLARRLEKEGVAATVLHGGISQTDRFAAVDGFRDGSIKVLVATDVAARGLDIPGITLVVNLELPSEPKQYVHRIGRTGRAGASGTAIAICDETERKRFQGIQTLIKQDFEPLIDHAWHAPGIMDDVMHRPGHWRAPSLHPDRVRHHAVRIPPPRSRKR